MLANDVVNCPVPTLSRESVLIGHLFSNSSRAIEVVGKRQ